MDIKTATSKVTYYCSWTIYIRYKWSIMHQSTICNGIQSSISIWNISWHVNGILGVFVVLLIFFCYTSFVTVHEIYHLWQFWVSFMVLVLVMGLRIMCGKYIKVLFLQILCRSKCYCDRKKMKIEMQRKLSASAHKRRQREKQKQTVSTRKLSQIERKEQKEYGCCREKKYGDNTSEFREISMLHANLMKIMVLKAKKNWMRLKWNVKHCLINIL